MLEALIMGSKSNRVSLGEIKAIRLILLGSSSGSWVGLTELRAFNQEGLNVAYSNNAVAEASSFYPSTYNSYNPYRINDNDLTSGNGYWCSASGNNANENRTCWIGLRFKQKVDIRELIIHGLTNYHPTEFDVEISNDGIVFEKMEKLFLQAGLKLGQFILH